MVATALDIEFYFTEPALGPQCDGLFPVKYRLPSPMRALITGKRVAIANDVVNAGSAVRGTYQDLKSYGAKPIVVGTLAILGTAALSYFAERGVPLESLAQLPNDLWLPQECPFCASGEPLDNPEATTAQAGESCGPG
jgi:orotate phosphoribosyltransferase